MKWDQVEQVRHGISTSLGTQKNDLNETNGTDRKSTHKVLKSVFKKALCSY